MKTLKTIGYYLISYTWGIVMTLIGTFAALFLLITGHTPYHFYQNIYFRVGKGWGGINFGPFFIIDNDEELDTKQHESGHGIQNICLGPLMPFMVGIPSMIRYYLRDWKAQKDKIIFSSIVCSIICFVGIVVLILGILFKLIPVSIIGLLIIAYAIAIYIWLMCKEIPQYKNTTPSYYAIWFEGGASKIGEKLYPEDNSEEEDQK